MSRFALIISALLLLAAKPQTAWAAGDFVEDPSSSSSSESNDSNFDPFSDYSEFEEGSEEEADINFFHNGRFFSIGLVGGYQSFTDTLGLIYDPSFEFGIFIEYFFDLKLAMQVAYISSNHSLSIPTGTTTYYGSMGLTRFEFDFKYYLNTQNVTRGLAALNPYLIFGGATYSRRQTINTQPGSTNDSAFGAQAGGGIEIPIMHNSSFIGFQATYNYIAFPDEGQPITVSGVSQGLQPNGDAISLLGIIGMSF